MDVDYRYNERNYVEIEISLLHPYYVLLYITLQNLANT